MATTRGIRTIDPLSVGSGARMRELIKLPYWLAVSWLALRGVFRNPLITLSFLVGFYLWYKWGVFTSSIIWGFVLSLLTVLLIWAGTIGTYWVVLGGRWQTGYWYYKLRTSWRHAITNVGLRSRDNKLIPRYYRVRPVKGGLRFNVNMTIGGRVINDLRAEADDLAEIIGARRVQVFPLKRVGHARVVLLWEEEQVFSVGDMSEDMSSKARESIEGDYTRIAFGKTGMGEAYLSLMLSIFIAGLSTSGKSNILKAIFRRLITQKIPHELYVIDPAGGVELTELEHYPHTLAYADMPNKADAIVEKAYKDMLARKEAMRRRGVNRIWPSNEFPLRVVLIDELLILGDEIKKVPESKLSQILAVGSKFAYVVIALSQLSQVDATGRIRSLFPQRICLSTDSADMTDACLGKGAEAAGAKCSEIPLSAKGVGYYKNQAGKGFTRFKAGEVVGSLVDVDEKSHIRPVLTNRRCAHYRYYDINGRLLYTGKAFDPEKRAKQHAASKLWWGHIDHTRTKIDWYNTEEDALRAEDYAIANEHPLHNVKGQRAKNWTGEPAA
jgi:hypothetical protein